jgi:hypothetical protein
MAGRALGWACLAIALLAAGGDVLRTLETGALVLTPIGEWWMWIDADGVAGARLWFEGLHPALWDPAIAWLLRQPAVLAFGAAGLLLLLLVRRPPHRPRPRIGARLG